MRHTVRLQWRDVRWIQAHFPAFPDRRSYYDRVQTAIVDSCFDLVGFRQHDVASNEVIGWSTDHPTNADAADLR